MGTTYEVIFEAVRIRLADMGIDQVAAEFFIADFEVGLRNAIERSFKNVPLKGRVTSL